MPTLIYWQLCYQGYITWIWNW